MNPEGHDVSRVECNWFGDAMPELMGVYPLSGGGLVESYYRHWAELRVLRRLLGGRCPASILELGGGTGRWALSLAPECERYTLVDLSEKALSIAAQRLRARNLEHVELILSDICSVTPTGLYALIYFSGASQFLEDKEFRPLLSRLESCLAPGGIMVDRSSLESTTRIRKDEPSYFSVYRTTAELDRLFAEIGVELLNRVPSYPLMRACRIFNQHHVRGCLIKSYPLGMYLIRACSWLLDSVIPQDRSRFSRCHFFSVYGRKAPPHVF